MLLKNKVLAIITFITLFLLFCTFYVIDEGYLLIYISLLTIASASLYWLLQQTIINRVEKLNHQLSPIIKEEHLNSSHKRILIDGNDEIAGTATHINELLETNETSQKDYINVNTFNTQNNGQKLKHEKNILNKISYYDNVTTLPNLIFFNEILNKVMNHSARHKKILALLLVDIDKFRETTKNQTEESVQRILTEIGHRLLATLRQEDILAKSDSDEYYILLNDIHKAKFASTVAQKLLRAISLPFYMNDHELRLSASIGICIYPEDGQALEELLKNAEQALAKAKLQGGNQYYFHSDQMQLEAQEYTTLESALKNAIANHELALYFQPKLELKTGEIIGVETLLRWHHPTLGSISPNIFIPIAEDCGMMMEIGEWALQEACQLAKYWHEEGYEHISVAVNLSTKQFHHPGIAKQIQKILNETELNPHSLELEINEQTVMSDLNHALEIFDELKKTGVRMSIDHFGTGYTSISYLKKFPINSIKIDKSFIKGIPVIPDDIAIVSAMIALTHNLGLEVIAESVETAEQAQFLTQQNCDIIQGYFLSKPLSAKEVVLKFKKLSEKVLV